MAATIGRPSRTGLHPIQAVLLSSMIPLFLGAALSDVAYSRSYQVQWANFASWLIAGGLVFGGAALIGVLIGVFRRHGRGKRRVGYVLLLLATLALGFINALVHAKDAWATMPMGLILSVVVAALAIVTTAAGIAGRGAGGSE